MAVSTIANVGTTGFPIPVMRQLISEVTAVYPLASMRTKEMVANGLLQIFYYDYKGTDVVKGTDDVSIADFNPTGYKKYSEEYKVNIDLHGSMPFWDSALNDITLRPSTFIALVNNFKNGILKPIAFNLFQRFMTTIDDDGFYDEVISFKERGNKIVEKAKELYEKIISLQTPSRDHLKKRPTGAVQGLEYSAKTSNMLLIFNSTFAKDYKYDLTAGTFQMGEIKLNIPVTVLDFAKLSAYSTRAGNAKKFAAYQVLLVDKNIYKEIVHYEAAKNVNTPKMKVVIHQYIRYGIIRLKNKIAIAFK